MGTVVCFLMSKKQCIECGKTLIVNKINFDFRILKSGQISFTKKCKSCLNIIKKKNRYKNIDRYRAQARKRRHSKEYAEGRFPYLGNYGWTHAAEDRIRTSMSWILGNKKFSNKWEKKFHRMDGLFRSSIVRRENNPINKTKSEIFYLKQVQRSTGIKKEISSLNIDEKKILKCHSLIETAFHNFAGKRYLRLDKVWEKKFNYIIHQFWQGR